MITVRYKLVKGKSDINLILSAKGNETVILRESNLKVVTTSEVADDGVWIEKRSKSAGFSPHLAIKRLQ